MHKLAEGSLKNRAFVALLSTVIAVLGIFSVLSLKQELIPRVELPAVNIMTISAGATSEQMKSRVSTPIEQQVSTIDGVESTSTQSSSSLSVVTVELEYGTDISRAANKIEQAITRANTNFPEDAEPQVIAGGTSDIPLSYVAITSQGDALETADRVRKTVVPALEDLQGLSNVQLIGAPEQIVTISVDQVKVAQLKIPADAIQKALEDNGLSVPVGALPDGERNLDVTLGQQISSIDELKALPIAADGQVYKISDIAAVDLTEGDNSMIGRLNGESAVAIILYPNANANLVDLSHAVNDKLKELQPIVGADTKFTTLFEQAPYITGSIRSLAQEGIMGLVFAVAVILLFLVSLRSTLVTAISIPLSLLVGFIGMLISGYSLNMLTLAALTLTIGRVVDDSIVVIENIKRHLEYGEDKKQAILTGVKEVASAVTASTIVSFIVFIPIGLVSGLVGELFRPFAFTVVIAMAASLFVALTIVPVLAYWFLKPSKEARLAFRRGQSADHRRRAEEKEEHNWLRKIFRPAFMATQAKPVVTLLASLVILAGTAALYPTLKINLLGSTNQGMVFLTQEVTPGASTEAQIAQAATVEDAVEKVAGVNSVATIIGASAFGAGSGGVSYMVAVDESLPVEEVTDRITSAAEKALPENKISAGDTALLGGSTIEVDITAPNDDVLKEASDTLTEELAKLPEAELVENNLDAQAPAIQITVNRDLAAKAGLSENSIVGIIAAQMVRPEIGKITIDNIDTKIYMSIAHPVQSISDLKKVQVVGQPLETFAKVEEVTSIPTIVTKNSQRTATVSVTPKNTTSLGATSDAVQEAIAKADLPDGAVTSMAGAAEQLADSFSKLLMALAAAILLIYVTLVWIFKSLLQPALLLIAIPFAVIGSFLALIVTNTPLDLSAMIGMLMLTGIVVTNAVVLIDLINQYRERGEKLVDAVHDGTMRRLRPIVMTALATIAAMIPMAVGVSKSSGFISQPLAITVIGGLISSTLLTLVLLPVIYRLVEGGKEKRAARRAVKREAELDALETALVSASLDDDGELSGEAQSEHGTDRPVDDAMDKDVHGGVRHGRHRASTDHL